MLHHNSFRFINFAIAFASSFLANGCYPNAYAAYVRAKSLEVDPVPTLYSGPLTVEIDSGHLRRTIFSNQGSRRIVTTFASGNKSNMIDDPKVEKIYIWGPDGQVRIQRMSMETKSILYRWHNRDRAQRVESCTTADEVGSLFRFTVGPNLKGANGQRYEACITSDGVVLTEAVYSSDNVRHMRFAATKVVRGTLAADIFTPPALQTKTN